MKFESIDALAQYLYENKVSISDIEMRLPEGEPPEILMQDVQDQAEVVFPLASNDVVAEASYGSENILYVESFEVTPNLCGTGRVRAFGRDMWLNMCEMDGTTKVTLSTIVDGDPRSTEFVLKYISEKDETAPLVQLART